MATRCVDTLRLELRLVRGLGLGYCYGIRVSGDTECPLQVCLLSEQFLGEFSIS